MTGAISIPILYPACFNLLIASIRPFNLDVPNSTLLMISSGLTLTLTMTFPLCFKGKIGSTISNLVGKVSSPFEVSLKFSIVHTKLFVIVFSKIKSLLLPISKVSSLFDFSEV